MQGGHVDNEDLFYVRHVAKPRKFDTICFTRKLDGFHRGL
jgi:hypothetical protein